MHRTQPDETCWSSFNYLLRAISVAASQRYDDRQLSNRVDALELSLQKLTHDFGNLSEEICSLWTMRPRSSSKIPYSQRLGTQYTSAIATVNVT